MELDDNLKQNDNEPIEPIEANVLRIDKRTLKILTKPDCSHQWVDDPEVIGGMRAQTCLYCPLGRWIQVKDSLN